MMELFRVCFFPKNDGFWFSLNLEFDYRVKSKYFFRKKWIFLVFALVFSVASRVFQMRQRFV